MFTIPGLPLRVLSLCAVTFALAACTTQDSTMQDSTTAAHAGHRHGAAPDPAAGATMMGRSGASATGSGAGPAAAPDRMDMGAMCTMHRAMRDAPEGQRQQLLDEHMKGMSPEMRQRHMEMMRQHCK